MNLAIQYFKSFSLESQDITITCLHDLYEQISLGIGTAKEYYLFLDNDVLNAIQKPLVYKERYVALSILFGFLRTSNLDFKITITPTIFIEFSEEWCLTNLDAFNLSIKFLSDTVMKTGLPLYQFGLSSYEEARQCMKNMKSDLNQITQAIKHIRDEDYHLVSHDGDWDQIKIPRTLAMKLAPTITTKYFSKFHTEQLIQSMIEEKILNSGKTDKNTRKKWRNDHSNNKAKLVTLKWHRVKGLGDLSIFSVCDLGSQFHLNSSSTSIGITFDRRLRKVLYYYSWITISSEPINNHKNETEESIHKKLKAFFEEDERLYLMDKCRDDFEESYKKYLDSIKWSFV